MHRASKHQSPRVVGSTYRNLYVMGDSQALFHLVQGLHELRAFVGGDNLFGRAVARANGDETTTIVVFAW